MFMYSLWLLSCNNNHQTDWIKTAQSTSVHYFISGLWQRKLANAFLRQVFNDKLKTTLKKIKKFLEQRVKTPLLSPAVKLVLFIPLGLDIY